MTLSKPMALHTRSTYITLDPEETEPTCYSTVAKYPEWRKAMSTQIAALMQTGTWTLVPPTTAHNVIGCKWVFLIKRKAYGSIDRFKARLVAKGFH